MMWSNRFVFIHIPRTGGDSLTAAFQHHLAISRDMYQWKHARASSVRATLVSEQWDHAEKFTVIRHPWDMVVSWYNHAMTWHEDGDRDWAAPYWERFTARAATLGFARFVEDHLRFLHGLSHYEYYCNAPGIEPLTLDQAYRRLCEITGAAPELPHCNASRQFASPDRHGPLYDRVCRQCSTDVEIWERLQS